MNSVEKDNKNNVMFLKKTDLPDLIDHFRSVTKRCLEKSGMVYTEEDEKNMIEFVNKLDKSIKKINCINS